MTRKRPEPCNLKPTIYGPEPQNRGNLRFLVANRPLRSTGVNRIFTDLPRSCPRRCAPSPRRRHHEIRRLLEAIRMAPDGALAYKNWDHVDVDPRAIDAFP